METQVYKVRDPSGRMREIRGPAGASDDEIIAQAKKLFSPAPDASKADPAPQQPDAADRLAGSPTARFALGAAAPIMGAVQLGAEALGRTGVSDHLRRLEGMKRRGMTPAAELQNLIEGRETIAKLPGYEAALADIDKKIAKLKAEGASANENAAGVDLAGIAGNILSPVSLGLLKAPIAGTAAGRVGQGVGIGAGFGLLSPVTNDGAYADEKAKQVAGGGILGGMIPAGLEGVRGVAGLLRKSFFPGAGEVARRAAGDKVDDVISALKTQTSAVPGERLTAGQASVPANSAEFAALQRLVASRDPSGYYGPAGVAGQQQTARRAAIQTIGKDKAALDAAYAARTAGGKADYGDAFAQAVRADPELAKLSQNPYFKKALPGAMDLAKAGGVDPKKNLTEFLHYVKLGLDDQVSGTARDAIGRSEQRAAANAKDQLVAWLASKNPAYDTARANFAARSKPINEMEVGQYLEQKLVPALDSGERASVFAQAVRDAPLTLKRSTGQPRYESLDQVLAPAQNQTVRNVMDSLQRDSIFNELAKQGTTNMRERISPVQAPPTGFFKPIISAARSWINRASEGSLERAMDQLAPIMKDPQKMALLMEQASPKEKQAIREIIDRMGRSGIIGMSVLDQSARKPEGILAQ
jgi:hypothetical protein